MLSFTYINENSALVYVRLNRRSILYYNSNNSNTTIQSIIGNDICKSVIITIKTMISIVVCIKIISYLTINKNPLHNQHGYEGVMFNYAGRLQSTCTSMASHIRVKANLKLSKDSKGFTVNRSYVSRPVACSIACSSFK